MLNARSRRSVAASVWQRFTVRTYNAGTMQVRQVGTSRHLWGRRSSRGG